MAGYAPVALQFMGGKRNVSRLAKIKGVRDMQNIIPFQKRKPSDVHDYIDYDKGWKFTEDDKKFLIAYYENWIKVQIEEFDGDFVEQPTETLNSIKKNGVEASKNLIQSDAVELSDAVCNDIYKYYVDDENVKLIENSILDVQW